MEVNNKIRTASVDQYCGSFPNSDSPKCLTQGSKICLESPHKILSRSNGQIDNYDCCRKPGLLRFLRQNPNLTLLGSYHMAEPYQSVCDRIEPQIKPLEADIKISPNLIYGAISSSIDI